MLKCKMCGRRIRFVRTPSGKHLPCETAGAYYRATQDGPDKLVTGDGYVVAGEVLPGAAPGALVGWVPHWANCPGAKRAKKRGACPTKTVAAAKVEKMTLPKAEQLEFGEKCLGQTGRNR